MQLYDRVSSSRSLIFRRCQMDFGDLPSRPAIKSESRSQPARGRSLSRFGYDGAEEPSVPRIMMTQICLIC